MNSVDIAELQLFLIDESSKIHKKSDKTIENHSRDANKSDNIMNLRKVGNIVKQKFFKKTPVELSSHTYFYEVHIDKSECKTHDEKYVWDYLYDILLKLPKKFLEREDVEKYDDPSVYKIKNILCKLVDLNPKKFGVTFRKIDQENIIFEYAELISDGIRILRNDINKYIYLHFTHAKNLKMIDIARGSSHYNGTYSKPSIFFYAVKKSGNVNARISILLKNINRSFDYGDQVYQYIPKLSDEIYLDPTDLGKNGVVESLNNSGYAPVVILTNHALPVRKYDIQHMSDKIASYYVNKDYDESWKSEDINSFIRNEAYKCKCDVCDVLQLYFNEKDANSVKSSPKKRFKQLLSEKVNEHMKNVDNMLEQKNIGISERRKFKAYYVKQCKIEIEREFSDWGDPSQGYTNTTKRLILSYIHEYFEESNINEIIVDFYIDETIERFDAFMEEFNNGQIGNSEFIMESAQDNEYAKIVKDYIKKSGRRYFKYKRCEDHLPKEVEDRIFDLAKKIVEFPPNGNYSQYKMYYKSFCKIVNYPLDTVIMGPMINNEYDGHINMGGLNYPGAKRCVLKPGTHLFHSSDNPNLTMINPNHFKGKPNIVEIGDEEIPTGDYNSYYACPRIYFHVEKMGSRQASASGTVKYDSNNMPIIENKPTSGHMYMYIVKPTDRIFFDPELNIVNSKDGAVYMLIDKPVRLTKIY